MIIEVLAKEEEDQLKDSYGLYRQVVWLLVVRETLEPVQTVEPLKWSVPKRPGYLRSRAGELRGQARELDT